MTGKSLGISAGCIDKSGSRGWYYFVGSAYTAYRGQQGNPTNVHGVFFSTNDDVGHCQPSWVLVFRSLATQVSALIRRRPVAQGGRAQNRETDMLTRKQALT